jgi:hypothetical protein
VLSSEMLGYPPQARVLIINANNFGMLFEVELELGPKSTPCWPPG